MSSLISDTAVSLPAPGLRPFIAEYAGFRVSGLPPGAHFGLPWGNRAGDLIEMVLAANAWRQRFSGRFRDAIGVTPKSAARVFRFERAQVDQGRVAKFGACGSL